MNKESLKGHAASIVTNVMFGLNISITKSLIASAWMTPPGYTTTRMIICAGLFWSISLFMPREKIDSRDRMMLVIGGLLGFAVTQMLFSIGMKFISPVIWSLISALSPIVVLLMSALFLKDPVSLKKAIGVIIGISGAAFMILRSNSGSSASILGIILALISVLSFSANYVVVRKTSLKYKSVTVMKWMFLWAAVFVTPFGIGGLPGQRLFSSEVTLRPILQLGFAVLCSNVLGFFLMPIALKRIKATTASIYSNLQPISASIAAIIIGQDVFTWDKPVALALIILGVFIVTQDKYKSKRENSP